MLCGECGLAMRMVQCETRPEQEDDALRVYHVARLVCGNERCACRGVERENKTVLWEDAGVVMREVK